MRAWAEASGSAPWNFRDIATGAPLDLVKYPKANAYYIPGRQGEPCFISPANIGARPAGGGAQNGWGVPEDAHFPALSYVAFLATGDPYFLEGTQFEANQAFIATAYWSTPTAARVDIGQTRSAAWSLRSLIMACVAAREAEKTAALPSWLLPAANYETVLQNNHDWLTAWMNNDTEAGTVFAAMTRLGNTELWEEDFLVFVYGFAVFAGYDYWRDMYLWKMKSTLARTDGKSGWPRSYCSPYYTNFGANWNDTDFKIPGSAALQQAHPGALYYKTWGDCWVGFVRGETAGGTKDGTQITRAVAARLAADPANGGRYSGVSGDYLAYTYGALSLAAILGLQEAVEPLQFVAGMVKNLRYLTGRWAIDGSIRVASVTQPLAPR
jgi:hypothetical protein